MKVSHTNQKGNAPSKVCSRMIEVVRYLVFKDSLSLQNIKCIFTSIFPLEGCRCGRASGWGGG